jgi:hypothetical protein
MLPQASPANSVDECISHLQEINQDFRGCNMILTEGVLLPLFSLDELSSPSSSCIRTHGSAHKGVGLLVSIYALTLSSLLLVLPCS